MSRTQLQAQPRSLQGKKVKNLRREGLLPGNVYGPGIESTAVQLSAVNFRKTLRSAGETELIDLAVEGEKEPRPVLISEVQVDPVKDLLLHADFYQVDLTQKVEVDVPLAFINADKANKQGIVLELINELEVETYPDKIPSEFTVDLSILQEIDQTISVADLQVPEGVEIRAEANELVAKLNPPEETLEEEEERLAEEEALRAAVEPEEGEELEEGEEPLEAEAEVVPEKPEEEQLE